MSASLSKRVGPEFEKCSEYDAFFNGGEQEALKSMQVREVTPMCSPSNSCNTNLFFGFFFDGTGNNYIAAERTKDHSNVARLYDYFPGIVHRVEDTRASDGDCRCY